MEIINYAIAALIAVFVIGFLRRLMTTKPTPRVPRARPVVEERAGQRRAAERAWRDAL